MMRKILKAVLRFGAWFLICMGLLICFSGTLSLPAYFSPEADLHGWNRLWTALFSLLIAALGAAAAVGGYCLRGIVNGTYTPGRKQKKAAEAAAEKTEEAAERAEDKTQDEAAKQTESAVQPEPVKQAEPSKKPEPAEKETPVKKPDFSQMSDMAVWQSEDVIVLRWRKAGKPSVAECRAAADGYEMYYVRNIHDRSSAAGKPWLKILPQQLESKKGFENYIGWALELNGSPASEAAGHIRKFILDREKQNGKKKKEFMAPEGGKLADRIKHGYEKPDGGRNRLTLCEMNGIFLVELFKPQVTEVKEGWREWIAVDLRDSRPYYIIIANEIADGRRTRYYDVKEPVTWEEVVSLAQTTTDAYGKKFLEASADTWMQCRDLWKRSHKRTENSISITWNEKLMLSREVRCTFSNGCYEVFYGGQHGPEDRTGFGVTETLPEKACESLSALQEFARGKFDSETGSVFGFISKHQEERLMKERGVVRPPVSMWGLGLPPFEHERYIALKSEGCPPHRYEHEALVKVSGGWFHHSEAAWHGGYSHSDGGCSEVYLKDVNDDNVEEYVRRHKSR